MKIMKILSISVVLLSGCSLDSVSEQGDKCPGKNDESGKTLQFIVKDTGSDSIRCNNAEDCPEYAENFELSICPKDVSACHQTTDDEYYCLSCSSNQVACNGECVDPNSNDHCGASGKCNSIDPKSEDFYGKKCDTDQRCEKGVCTVR